MPTSVSIQTLLKCLERLPKILLLEGAIFPTSKRKYAMQSITDQELPSEEYLCDYVYIDNIKLSHYYSQLSQHGLVITSKKISKESGKQGSTGQVKLPILSGGMAAETATEQSIELNVDSAFSRPQETLDALFAAGYIQEGISNSRIGSLILEKGAISLFDIRILKDIWIDMTDMVAASSTADIQNIKERQRLSALKKKEFGQIATIISKMPHSLQGTLSANGDAAWFTLKPECMLVNAEDLTFKHGSDLKGEWHVLGILDALPDHCIDPAQMTLFTPGPIEGAMRSMLDGLRAMLGRPSDRYGITPVMIFRTIKKH